MMAYYFILILLSLFSFFEVYNKKKAYYEWLFVSFLAIFVGIRYNVGNDYAEYYQLFFDIQNGFTPYFEPLFLLLNKITFSPEIMFFTISVLTFIFLYKALKYFSGKYFFIALTIYYGLYLVLFNIHIVRQGLAIAVVLYAYRFVIEKKNIQFVLLVLSAAMFHKTAIIAIPIAYLARIKFSKQSFWVLLALVVLIAGFNKFYISFIFKLMANIESLSRYAEVYNNNKYSSNYGISIGIFFDIFVLLFFLLRNKDFEERNRFIFNLFFISVLISILLSFAAIFLRLNYYFRIMNVFVIASLLDSFRPKFIIMPILLLFALLYLYMILNTGVAVVEYHTIFKNLLK